MDTLNSPEDIARKTKEEAATKKPTRQALPSWPWASEVLDDDSDRAKGRVRWREALALTIAAVVRDTSTPTYLRLPNIRRISGLVQAVTFEDPGLVADESVFAENALWDPVGNGEGQAFFSSQCTDSDRLELLQWLGRATARVNWHSRGPGSSPMTVSIASRLMLHWEAVAWRGRDAPDWCRRQVDEQAVQVYPEQNSEGIFRSWTKARDDMHGFLTGWQDERVKLGPRRPRRNGHGITCVTADEMGQQLVLLRALAVDHPGVIDERDAVTLRTMDRLLDMRKHVWPTVQTAVEVLEDRQYLERGLEKIPEQPHPVERGGGLRRRKI